MKNIAADIKSREFKKLYIFYGEEAYLKQLYLKNLLKALGAAEGDMNYSYFTGKNVKDDDIVGICETMPFFADKRVVYLDGLNLFKEKHETLEEYSKRLPDHLVLIINEEAVDKRSKLYKTMSKEGYAAEFSALDEKALLEWAAKKLAKDGKKIRKDTCEYLLSCTGNDLNYLNNELEKLIAYTSGRDVVTEDDIKAIVSPVVENKIFDLVSAVTNGNPKEAFIKYNDLITLKESPMKILFLLARAFDQMLHIKELQDEGMGASLIAESLKMNPYVVKKIAGGLRGYSKERLLEAVTDMVNAEADIKGGRLDERLSVELMIVKYSKRM